MTRAVLWDLDGTLIDSAGDIAGAIDRMLAGRGCPPLGEAVVRGFVGDGARRLVDRCVSAAGVGPDPRDLEAFLAAYRAHPVDRTCVYAGLHEVLTAVDAPQGIVTNKPEGIARLILERLGLSRFFGVVVGGDTLPVRKPDPAPVRHALRALGAETGVLVGDGPADVSAGLAAGVEVLGVAWGIAEPLGAATVARSPAELLELLRRRGVAR